MSDPAYKTPETLLNDPDSMRDALADRIKHQAIHLRDSEASKREQWAAIGADLLMARESMLSTNEFGVWIEGSGIKELPGLQTASARSDVIWLAEYPGKADKIEASISAPRTIRHKWRLLFSSSCVIEADALIAMEATEVPDVEAAADGVAATTGSTQKEAFDEITRLIAVSEDTSGVDIENSIAKALPKLKKALQAAADAGVTHSMLCINAGAVWGGFFSWSHQPAPSNVQESMLATVGTAKDEGLSFKDFISLAGEAFTA